MRKSCGLLAVAALVGCGRAGSEQIGTEEITAEIVVAVDPAEDTTLVTALLTENGEAMDFNGNDVLRATAQGISLVLVPNPEDEGDEAYSRGFDFAADAEDVIVALERTRDGGAPESIIGVPGIFALSTFAEAQSRAEDIELTWTEATADPMEILGSADCLTKEYSATIDDPLQGSFVIPAGSLVTTASAGDVCLVDFEVQRWRSGSLDPAYAGGIAEGVVYRTLRVETKN